MTMRFAVRSFLGVLALALFFSAVPRACLAAEVTVFAAASLADVCVVLKQEFEKRNPGVTVVLNTGASGLLLRQMEQGALADVFISADEQTMDQAVERAVVDKETRRVVAGNTLVLAVQPGQEGDYLVSLSALASPGVRRVAMGNPESVPAGRYAKETLEGAGLWEAVAPKLILAENVRQALEYLVRGEVDAAFVFGTDAAKAASRARAALTLPTKRPVTYPAALAAGANNAQAGIRLLEFLSSPEAKAVFESHGFSKP